MKPQKRIKSFLGVAIVVLSLGIGGLLIFQQPEEPPEKSKEQVAQTKLKVSVKATGPNGLALVRNISCPQDQTRCALLKSLTAEDFQVPTDRVCAAVYGGPSVAQVYGVLNGQPLNVSLRVTNACEIALWNRLAPALGIPKSDTQSKIS